MDLDAFPRIPLLFGPSPVHPLDRLSEHLGGAVRVWAKREDCNSGLAFGGNKTRKLEYLVADAAAFQELGRLLTEQILPPRLAAAIYRAAARIPGVRVVPDSVDAAGRHGVAVALVAYGERSEWIFDKKTLTYLGERGYMVEDTASAKKGMVTATTAVLQRGVVNKAGELPGKP